MSDVQHGPRSVDVLLHEYSLLKSEINIKAQGYEQQITYSQFAVAAVVGTLAYLFNGGEASIVQALGWPHKWILALAAFVTMGVTFLLVFKVLESDFRMQVVATRMALIEQMVNERIGDNVMHWESFLGEDFTKVKGAIWDLNPSIFMAVLYFLLVGFGAVFIPLTLYWHALYDPGEDSFWLRLFVLIGIGFTLAFSFIAPWAGWKIHSTLRSTLRARMISILNTHGVSVPDGSVRSAVPAPPEKQKPPS
jgi:hypothetical protein